MRWNKQMGLALVLLGVLVLLATGNAYIRKGMQKQTECKPSTTPEAKPVAAGSFDEKESFRDARAELRSQMLSAILQCIEKAQDENMEAHIKEELSQLQRDMETEFAIERMMTAQGWESAGVFCWRGCAFVEAGRKIKQTDAIWIQELAEEIGNIPAENVYVHGEISQAG